MKIIHLKCGHRIQVKTWPSRVGMAKMRHHYKKFHPTRMKKMAKKSLATKRKRGLINPYQVKMGAGKGPYTVTFKTKKELNKYLGKAKKHHPYFRVLGVEKVKRKRGLIRNRCNPKKKGIYYKVSGWDGKDWYQLGYTSSKTAFLREALREGWKKSQIRFTPMGEKSINRKVNPSPKSTLIYDKLLGIEAHKSHGKFAGQNFKHNFESKTDAMVLGNPDGSLTIRSKKGKRLWKKFDY